MRSLLPPRRGRTLAVALALLVSCTVEPSSPPRDDPNSAIDRFLAAWSERDYVAMWTMLDPESRPWTPGRLETSIQRILAAGGMSGFEITRVSDEDPVGVPSRYEIEYEVPEPLAPVVLEGPLEGIAFDTRNDEWRFSWRPRMMLPGIPKAHKFRLVTRFPRRAPILDRNGVKIAIGRASDRRYPFGSLAGATIGHLEPLASRDPVHDGLREPGDIVGASGLERAFDERLAGRPAIKLQVVDRKGEILEILARSPARRGRPVHTTLDMRIQRAAQNAYATTGGAVVMDPRTGDLLATIASSPFDPNHYVGVSGIEPFNRALSGLYPPGSSLKVLTAAAALDTKTFKPSDQLTGPAEYKGVRNFESGVFGTLSFAEALQFSVNTAFAQIAEDIGPRRLTKYARRFGFNRSPAMTLEAARPSFPFPEDEGDLLWGSIGQAQVVATPLQMATLASTIANDGRRMEPRIAMHERRAGRRVVSKKTARTMVGLMENVVEGGTGVRAQIAGVRVAGKTGTAEVDVGGQRLNHAWFICFAPADDPKLAVAVVSEYGGVGGRVAAPIARAILAAVLPYVR